jgi:nitrogen regulatory protein PII
MKMLMIVYNEALDDEVMDVLEKCCTPNYTKMLGVYGKGTSSGTHLGNDIWPGRNNILYIACESEKAIKIFSEVKTIRKKLGKEGIKAFILPVEDVT